SLFLSTGPAAGGWTIYPPLSALPQAIQGSQSGMTLWLVAMALFIVSSLLGSINYITTVINMRTKGMSFTRMPLTIWAFFFIAILSFIVWAHHMFVTGMNPFLGSIFMLLTLIIAVPSAVKIFNYVTTLWKGNLRFTPGMLFSIGLVSFFLTGGITGIFLGNSAVDIQLHDTYFVVAHFHLVMGSA